MPYNLFQCDENVISWNVHYCTAALGRWKVNYIVTGIPYFMKRGIGFLIEIFPPKLSLRPIKLLIAYGNESCRKNFVIRVADDMHASRAVLIRNPRSRITYLSLRDTFITR